MWPLCRLGAPSLLSKTSSVWPLHLPVSFLVMTIHIISKMQTFPNPLSSQPSSELSLMLYLQNFRICPAFTLKPSHFFLTAQFRSHFHIFMQCCNSSPPLGTIALVFSLCYNGVPLGLYFSIQVQDWNLKIRQPYPGKASCFLPCRKMQTERQICTCRRDKT